MSRKAKRSVCPIACTLDLFGDKWSLVVIRDLFAGKTHYHEFSQSPEKIATNILASRLDHLVRSGFVKASASTQRVGSTSYSLTEKGKSLYPLLVAIRDWGLTHIAGTQARMAVPSQN